MGGVAAAVLSSRCPCQIIPTHKVMNWSVLYAHSHFNLNLKPYLFQLFYQIHILSLHFFDSITRFSYLCGMNERCDHVDYGWENITTKTFQFFFILLITYFFKTAHLLLFKSTTPCVTNCANTTAHSAVAVLLRWIASNMPPTKLRRRRSTSRRDGDWGSTSCNKEISNLIHAQTLQIFSPEVWPGPKFE